MPEVRFYHLQGQSLEEALPKLMAKVCEAGLKAVIKFPSADIRDKLDRALWEQGPATGFLPHGADGCSHPEKQPVYLTTTNENPADATIQVCVNALILDGIESFDRCLFMFDGRDEAVVSNARSSWKAIKDLGVEMSYWQQREMGGWEKKA